MDGNMESGERFWARAHAKFKFKVEALWMKEALECNDKQKPDYGIGQMLSKHEEVVGMKAELMGPIIIGLSRILGPGSLGLRTSGPVKQKKFLF